MTLKDIQSLRATLNASLDSLEKLYQDHSLDFPSLDEPYVSSAEAEDLACHPDAISAINTTVAAAYQLLCTVRHPFMTISDASCLHHLSACLRVAEKFNIAEILRENGSGGCHVDTIALRSGIEPSKIGRILRVLATHHIFREVTPNTFANNRVSSYIDTGKSSQYILVQPGRKYQDTSGAAAYIGTFTDDVAKASSYLLEDLEDPTSGHEFSASQAAFQKAFSTDTLYFSWLESPSNKYRFERYAACIRGTSLWDVPEAILQGFDWDSLPPGSLVVDVGGGTGAPAMILARSHIELRIIIQEREAVVEQGTEYWKRVYPEALQCGSVSFEVHDFFDHQPQTTAAVFIVRTICHDWPDNKAIQILRHLRKAASSHTKLILGDFIVPYACPGQNTESINPEIPGAVIRSSPAPLLGNFGKAAANVYWIDMTMQVLLNGQERTLQHHVRIVNQAGWNIVRVRRVEKSHFGYLVAEPM